MLRRLPLEENDDDFVFDNQMLAQAFWFGFRVGELSCPTRYEPESSSISLRRSIKYGFGVLGTTGPVPAGRSGGSATTASSPPTADGWTGRPPCRANS